MYSFNFTLQALFFFLPKFLNGSVQIPNENVSILAVNNAGNSKRLLHPIQLHVILTSCKLLLAYSHICRNKKLK